MPPDGNTTAIRCRELAYSYPSGDGPVFSSLDLDLATPGFHALFGPSGSGKTSLARILSGALEPDHGRLEAAPGLRVGYTHNQERIPDWSTVGRHLDQVTPPNAQGIRRRLEDIFGVAACLDRRFSRLSLGQKNRVNLLRWLVQGFDVLILDESLANVDEKSRARILMAVKQEFPATCFLYISHHLTEVARYCRIIHLLRPSVTANNGKPPAAIRSFSGLDLTAGEEADGEAFNRILLDIMGYSGDVLNAA
ncbi:MAG: nitrate ABC transporter ATP-binding protein [Desulfococcus sp.]|nr:MAG: nitrate ABC transporter ATP-binding protein [Desulfococcus sp.]